MRSTIFASLLTIFPAIVFSQNTDSVRIRTLYDIALSQGKSYETLDYLCNVIGARLSGSEGAEKAVQYTKKVMEGYGFDKVYLQEVMVPHWVRGEKEQAYIQSAGKKIDVPICALGGSVAAKASGLTASVIEVKSFEELAALGKEKVEGKIVFFNRPMNPNNITTFTSYGEAGNQRHSGALEAAKYNAAGVIVRSLGLRQDDFPHTGAMRPYNDQLPKLPAAAISTNGANLLSEMLKKDPNLKFYFKQSCETLPDAKSYNVIGEIKGTEKPEEIVLVGGHLDSWDLAQGAHDDGAGCVQSIEALRLFKIAGIKPKRTIRAVMFMNEENGLRGGLKYAELAKLKNENHIAAIESDAGGFTPRGFDMSGTRKQMERIYSWRSILAQYGLTELDEGGGGADIGPLRDQGTLLIGYRPDSQRYFDFHHAATDKFDGINRRELELGAASMATLLYLISEYGL